MASIYVRKNSKYLWIKWYDKSIHGFRYESTEFENTPKGRDDAKEFKEEFEANLKLKNRNKRFSMTGDVSLQQAFNHFLKNNTGKSDKTIYEYKHWFEKLKEEFPGNTPARKINKLDIEDWLNSVKKWPVQDNTKYNICKNTKKFLSFLFEYNYTNPFVINKDVLTKPEIKEKILFTENDWIKIFHHLNEQPRHFKVMIYLLTYSGRRPSDIMDITVDRIDLHRKTFSFYVPKNKRYTILPLHSSLIPVLQERINEIGSGRLISYKNLSNMGQALRKYLKKLKLYGKGYNLRTFRKTFDSLAYENGMEVMSAAELLGHSAAVAQKHYRKISMQRMRDELEKFQIPQKPVTLSVTEDGKLIESNK